MAFCSNCGKELAAGAKFCFECGTPVEKPMKQSEEQFIVEKYINVPLAERYFKV